MPFDCAPVIDEPKQGATTAVEALGTNIIATHPELRRVRARARGLSEGFPVTRDLEQTRPSFQNEAPG